MAQTRHGEIGELNLMRLRVRREWEGIAPVVLYRAVDSLGQTIDFLLSPCCTDLGSGRSSPTPL